MLSDVIRKKIIEAKEMSLINDESLEVLYESILHDASKMIEQKKTQIERILGELTQLKAMESFLFKALDRYLSAKKNDEAFKKYEEQAMKIKKEEAEKRMKQALEDDGIDLDGKKNEDQPEKIIIETEDENDTSNKKKARSRRV